MAYLTDLYFADPNSNKLYTLSNDIILSSHITVGKKPSAILVDKNMLDIWVVNTQDNSVDIIRNGEKINTISVGKYPIGICQAKDGSIYITNFTNNTVSKIVNYVKVKDISVGKGPRGICCDYDGNIFITNYLANTVTQLTNDIKVDEIKVGSAPYGICADKHECVYVACAGSNTVSVLQDGVKKYDINVGKNPWDVCCDKNGAIWVTNYNSKTVSKIVGSTKVLDILVGDGPFGVNTTEDGAVYVCNYSSNTITKIVNSVAVSTIHSNAVNPVGFGDATGFQWKYIFNTSSGGSGSGIVGKVTYADLDDDLQKLIIDAGSSGISLPIEDSDVNHNHPIYNTVKKALDYLLYVSPVITSFTNNVNNVEKGCVVNTVTLNYDTNKDMTYLSINNGVGSVLGTTSKTLTNLNITNDITYTITARDDQETEVTKSTSIKFLDKIYFGSSSSDSITNAQILSFDSKLASNYTLTNTFDCSGGKYIYIVVPKAFGLTTSKFKIGGLDNSAWSTTEITFTNASGYTSQYVIFKFNELQNGSAIKVDIV